MKCPVNEFSQESVNAYALHTKDYISKGDFVPEELSGNDSGLYEYARVIENQLPDADGWSYNVLHKACAYGCVKFVNALLDCKNPAFKKVVSEALTVVSYSSTATGKTPLQYLEDYINNFIVQSAQKHPIETPNTGILPLVALREKITKRVNSYKQELSGIPFRSSKNVENQQNTPPVSMVYPSFNQPESELFPEISDVFQELTNSFSQWGAVTEKKRKVEQRSIPAITNWLEALNIEQPSIPTTIKGLEALKAEQPTATTTGEKKTPVTTFDTSALRHTKAEISGNGIKLLNTDSSSETPQGSPAQMLPPTGTFQGNLQHRRTRSLDLLPTTWSRNQ